MYPSILTTYTNPQSTDRLNSPSHSGIETAQNGGLSQVEAVIGVEGASSVIGSLQYLIKSPASTGGGHVQGAAFGGTGQTTFTKGDILVAPSASVLSKLTVGSNNQIIVADSSLPNGLGWRAPSSVLSTVVVYKNGATTHDIATTGTQNIAHGLGTTPKTIKIRAIIETGDASGGTAQSDGLYNGTTTSTIYRETPAGTVVGYALGTDTTNVIYLPFNAASSAISNATVTMDATNIILTWAKTGSPTGTAYVSWEANT
jgi:hypothetical protein